MKSVNKLGEIPKGTPEIIPYKADGGICEEIVGTIPQGTSQGTT